MYENLCQPCIIQPTRIVDKQKPSLIDNIFINSIENPISGNRDKISDHFPNFIIINKYSEKREKSEDNYKRNTKNYNKIVFQNQLVEKFSKVYNKDLQVDNLSKSIIDTFTETLNENALMVNMTKKEIKNKQRPWITKGILKAIQIKTKWLKRFMKNKNKIKESMEYKNYKLYRDKINHLIRASKKNYYKSYFTEHQHNTKKTWTGINELIGKRKKSTTTSISLIENKKNITNTKDVANIFNNYFVNVAENLSKELGHPKYSVDTHLENPNKYNFFITPTDPQEVLKLINDIDQKKASDACIQHRFIKDSKFFLADALCKLFNVSIEDQCFPDTLKFAKVLPSHKGKSTMECKNYRPISVLPIFSKIIEKLSMKGCCHL